MKSYIINIFIFGFLCLILLTIAWFLEDTRQVIQYAIILPGFLLGFNLAEWHRSLKQ